MAGDDEGFLARWSRRKLEAETTAAEPSEPTAAPAASDQSPPSQPPGVAEIIARLPPIEEITASTDIRAFLAPGVPSELRLAALRQAWSTDPAIRDFIGLAENQWDFNAPDGVPGFGSLIDPDEVRRLLAKVVGGEDTEPERPPPETAAPNPARAEIAAAPDVTTPASEDQPVASAIPEAASESEPDETTARERRHGGALPR